MSGETLPATDVVGLLLCRDLMFTSRVTSEARALGVRVMTAGSQALAGSMIEQWRPRVVFVDLTAGEMVGRAALEAYRLIAGPSTTFIAYGPHVDRDNLAAAREAGCDLVLTRGKFNTDLPDLIRHYLAAPTADEQESNKSPRNA